MRDLYNKIYHLGTQTHTNPYKTDLDLILRSFLAKFYSNNNEKLDIL